MRGPVNVKPVCGYSCIFEHMILCEDQTFSVDRYISCSDVVKIRRSNKYVLMIEV